MPGGACFRGVADILDFAIAFETYPRLDQDEARCYEDLEQIAVLLQVGLVG
jgi:hypothetical protein